MGSYRTHILTHDSVIIEIIKRNFQLSSFWAYFTAPPPGFSYIQRRDEIQALRAPCR